MTKNTETRITDLENRVSALEKELCANPSLSVSKKRNLSVNEFLREKKPATAIDTILVIAVYHERFNDTDSFSANDLLDLIRKAKQKKPANINDLVNKNISKGYFEEDKAGEDGKKRWYVTSSGSELVENNFNRNEQNN
ncbi:MAG: hypothetical protein PHP47_03330 [Candidatus Pacebacteria bacterium]|jgi:hypothetical protein|nr:hypothetical protein [Candidatus Paceibacterota bacterium]MDD4467315.1 hypothetical protein [Candidatus Paceibacterota bacterium]